jgi:hypothetical protein
MEAIQGKEVSSFDKTNAIGGQGEAVIKILLESFHCKVKETPKDIELQLKFADFVIPGIKQLGIGHEIIEVKTELLHTGNLFFETVSNEGIDRAGWAYTSPAHTLYYLFWDDMVGYRIPDFQNVMWHFDYCKAQFLDVPQSKYVQHNKTVGKLVPIAWVMECYGVTKFNFEK